MTQKTKDLLWGALIVSGAVFITFGMPTVVASIYQGRLYWAFCAPFAGCTH